MKKPIMTLIAVFAMLCAQAQTLDLSPNFRLLGPLYDSYTFDPTINQSGTKSLVIMGYDVVLTLRTRPTNAIFNNGVVVARMQVGDTMANESFGVTGTVSDSFSTSLVVTGNRHGDTVWMIHRLDSLTLVDIYPAPAEWSGFPGRVLESHDMARWTATKRAAIGFQYDSAIGRYGDTVGSFVCHMQEINITDNHWLTKVIELGDLFPATMWNRKRSIVPSGGFALDPFHLNSMEFIDSSTLIVSMRSLGLASINVDQGTVNWFIGEDSLITAIGKAPILQHNLRSLGGGEYSFFSDGDGTVPQQGLVIKNTAGTWSVIRSFSPPADPARTYAMGSFHTTPDAQTNLLCLGLERNPALPFSIPNFSTRIYGQGEGSSAVDQQFDSTAVYAARFIQTDYRATASWVVQKSSDSILLIASHPLTSQQPIWYSLSSNGGGYLEAGRGDTVHFNLVSFQSAFYMVASNDASGWSFQSNKVGRQEALGFNSITDQANSPIARYGVNGVLFQEEGTLFDITGRKVGSFQEGSGSELIAEGIYIAQSASSPDRVQKIIVRR